MKSDIAQMQRESVSALKAENAQLKERIEALTHCAELAKDLLWKMQDGQVLEYSKPVIAQTILDIDEALLPQQKESSDER